MGSCVERHEGRILECPRDPPDSIGFVSEGTPREDPGMSKGSSGQHGGLCVRDTKGGSQDVQGILRTGWGPASERTPREDPGMSKVSSG